MEIRWTIFSVLIISAIVFVILMPVAIPWQSWRIGLGVQAVMPPKVSLTILIDGQAVSAEQGQIINVAQGTTIIPLVSVEQFSDIPVDVILSFAGRQFESGQVIPLTNRGYFTLEAVVTAGQWAINESVLLNVSNQPLYNAVVNVRSILPQAGQDGTHSLEYQIQLMSEEFDTKNIYMSHVSLWLLDDSNLTLDRLSVDTVGGKFSAEYCDEHWIINFSRKPDAEPLRVMPTKIMITGAGWEGANYIDFTTKPITLPHHEVKE